MTLRGEMARRNYSYNTIFGRRAEDIEFETSEEICIALGYILKHVQRIDAEIPRGQNAVLGKIYTNKYIIRPGYTSGGNPMKEGPQYRIYFDTLRNMPQKLRNRLQNDDKMRITGSLFVEACLYIGFQPGSVAQDENMIRHVVTTIFNTKSEIAAFNYGYSL